VYASEVLYAAVMQFDDGHAVPKNVRKTLKFFIRETVTTRSDRNSYFSARQHGHRDQFPLLCNHGSVNDQKMQLCFKQMFLTNSIKTGSLVVNFMKMLLSVPLSVLFFL
jgi:hypothetical protein